jgi:hypothetical protein
MSAFFLFTNERRAALVAENKSCLEVLYNLFSAFANFFEFLDIGLI